MEELMKGINGRISLGYLVFQNKGNAHVQERYITIMLTWFTMVLGLCISNLGIVPLNKLTFSSTRRNTSFKA